MAMIDAVSPRPARLSPVSYQRKHRRDMFSPRCSGSSSANGVSPGQRDQTGFVTKGDGGLRTAMQCDNKRQTVGGILGAMQVHGQIAGILAELRDRLDRGRRLSFDRPQQAERRDLCRTLGPSDANASASSSQVILPRKSDRGQADQGS